jgi:hypothetical protein
MKVFIGWDQRDALAYEVCKKTLEENSTVPVEIFPLKEWELRQKGAYWRTYNVDERGQMWDSRDGKPFSTNFSFTRFCVPFLEDYRDEWVLFCDADMMWRGDIAELFTLINRDKSVMCVKHDHHPVEQVKMDGMIQTRYVRKNWSSLMLMNPAKCRSLTGYAVNNQTGAWLHQMCWAKDDEIGEIPEEWNWLEGWSPPEIDPKVVHFTRGTPDMDPNVSWSREWWEKI